MSVACVLDRSHVDLKDILRNDFRSEIFDEGAPVIGI